ncbi:hypothetical protein AZ34_08675 [Hylemonella gracilis str. Niagara R]|uniref:4-phosphopantetheinyl transferase n=1 Tax=Hylemonella gracilis str. Niagara R TaxID=1458275 RepID=A0A016XLQ8_9BURK|nr:hypothetical protein AZ34_08675 [Hylemonella gracilis str. Niagara R]
MPNQDEVQPVAAWLALARVSEWWPHFANLESAPSPALAEFSVSEQERLRGITAPRRRAQFIVGRLLLRRLLRQLLTPTRTFSVSASDQGPPRLEDQDHDAPELHLALSHSGDWVCAAVAPLALGLDLEATEDRSRARDWPALATMAASPTERRALAALHSPAEQGAGFLRLWTLKEAWFKQQARALDLAVLPRLHTAPANDAAAFNAWVWQTEHCTLALSWSSTLSSTPLPVHWVQSYPVGSGHGPAPTDASGPLGTTAPLHTLAHAKPRPWHVGLPPSA